MDKATGFNPLTRIRSSLTNAIRFLSTVNTLGFNPLTRIRSSLTKYYKVVDTLAQQDLFQSPHEDSFFSDQKEFARYTYAAQQRFNPLTRIRSSLTLHDDYVQAMYNERFNPLTRIRSSLTRRNSPGTPTPPSNVSIPSRGFVLL